MNRGSPAECSPATTLLQTSSPSTGGKYSPAIHGAMCSQPKGLLMTFDPKNSLYFCIKPGIFSGRNSGFSNRFEGGKYMDHSAEYGSPRMANVTIGSPPVR